MTKADKEGQRKAPILRFKGFTDAWEQREFIQILKAKDGIKRGPFGSALKKEYFIPYGNYAVYEQRNAIYNSFNTRYYITQNKFEELKKFELVPGDIIMSGAGTIGRLAMIPSNSKPGVFNQALIRFRVNEQNDNLFFLYFMRTPKLQKKLTNVNPGSAMVNLVPIKEIKKWECLFPYKREQKRIVSLLSKMDSILTLYERKIKALKKLKQAIFEVLNSIPHKSNVYRISEIFDVTRGNVLSKKSISNKFSNMYPVYSSQTKNDGLLGYYSDYLFENSITWTTDGANAGTVKYRTGKFYCTNVCGVLLNSEGYCNEYTAEVIEKETPKFVSHVGNPKLMNNVMKQIKIKLPDVATQQSYSDILLTFDNVCTSFCNKLNDLNQIKNKLLNTMFI